MFQVHLDTLIMLAALLGGYKTRPYGIKQTESYVVAGSSPPWGWCGRDERRPYGIKQTESYVVVGFIPALGGDAGGYMNRPYGLSKSSQ
jgi:hypothetical protein